MFLDAGDRPFQECGDLLERVALDIEEHGDQPLALGQPGHSVVDGSLDLGVFDDERWIGHDRRDHYGGVDRYSQQVVASKLPITVFDQNPTKPTRKSGGLTQLGQAR